MIRTAPVALLFLAAWVGIAPLASAHPIGECRAICAHHHGDYRFCYDDCLRQ